MIKCKNAGRQAVWRQAGRCFVLHFAGIWEFATTARRKLRLRRTNSKRHRL